MQGPRRSACSSPCRTRRRRRSSSKRLAWSPLPPLRVWARRRLGLRAPRAAGRRAVRRAHGAGRGRARPRPPRRRLAQLALRRRRRRRYTLLEGGGYGVAGRRGRIGVVAAVEGGLLARHRRRSRAGPAVIAAPPPWQRPRYARGGFVPTHRTLHRARQVAPPRPAGPGGAALRARRPRLPLTRRRTLSGVIVLHVQKVAGISGSEAHLLQLLPALAQRGWDIRFLMLHEQEPGAWEFARALEAGGRAGGRDRDEDRRRPEHVRARPLLPRRRTGRRSSTRTSCTPTRTARPPARSRACRSASRRSTASTSSARAAIFALGDRTIGALAHRQIAISRGLARYLSETEGFPEPDFEIVHYGIAAGAEPRAVRRRARRASSASAA